MMTYPCPAASRAALVAAVLLGASIARAEPATPAPPTAAVPTKEAAREQTALKIAGLVTFVANSGHELKPDYARFKTIIRSLGLDEQRLAQPEMKNRYLSYTAAYQADRTTSCERASTQFGPKGSTLPGLFAPQ